MAYPVACCLHSLQTAPCNGDMLTINRLLMGGTLREHSIGGRVIFVLEPGLIVDDKLVSDVEMKPPPNRTLLILLCKGRGRTNLFNMSVSFTGSAAGHKISADRISSP